MKTDLKKAMHQRGTACCYETGDLLFSGSGGLKLVIWGLKNIWSRTRTNQQHKCNRNILIMIVEIRIQEIMEIRIQVIMEIRIQVIMEIRIQW